MNNLHYPHEVGLVWNIWLPPNEAHDHWVWMGGIDREHAGLVAPNGKTGQENLFANHKRYSAAGLHSRLSNGSHTIYCICHCRGCALMAMLASATLAKFEGRMHVYAEVLERIKEF